MKCITCSQEIPDASTICPYCNNNVQPVANTNNVLPQTPQDYKLPKDQIAMTQQINTVNVQDTNNQVQNVPTPPAPPTTNNASEVQAPPQMITNTQSYFDPTKIDLQNVDLNANANAQTLDYTQINASEKLGSTIDPNTKAQPKNKKGKTIFLLILLVLLIGGSVLGYLFYKSQFKSASDRIDKVVDGIFGQISNINNTKYEKRSGSYKLSYSSSKNDNELVISADGKYGIDLPNKKVDLIANIKDIKYKQKLLDKELNVELYIENNRAYVLLQNFKDDYVYTEVDNSYNVIKDIESRFNNPEDLLLFKSINLLYDNGIGDLTKNYFKFITNISQNEIKYQTITRGIKEATKEALKAGNPVQKIENGNNVIRINLGSPDKLKMMNKAFVNALKNNKQAWNELVTLYGDEKSLTELLNKTVDEYEYKGIKSDIVIVTDMFKKNFKYIIIPSIKDDKICSTKITPIGGGYSVITKLDGRDIVNIKYTRSSTKQSTTETKTYKLTGVIYTGEVADNINLELELVDDINPEKISVITRNSIDYQYLTENDFNELANKIQEFGNLGVLFKSYYKGYQEEEPRTEPSEPGEPADPINTPEVQPDQQATEGE